VDLLMLLLCGFVLLYGSRLCRDTLGQSVAELPWLPVGITYAAIPLGALATLLFVLERMLIGPQNHRDLLRLGDAG
jgi:TRAP-type C4-dicarboxylate transport system permease small subunit